MPSVDGARARHHAPAAPRRSPTARRLASRRGPHQPRGAQAVASVVSDVAGRPCASCRAPARARRIARSPTCRARRRRGSATVGGRRCSRSRGARPRRGRDRPGSPTIDGGRAAFRRVDRVAGHRRDRVQRPHGDRRLQAAAEHGTACPAPSAWRASTTSSASDLIARPPARDRARAARGRGRACRRTPPGPRCRDGEPQAARRAARHRAHRAGARPVRRAAGR